VEDFECLLVLNYIVMQHDVLIDMLRHHRFRHMTFWFVRERASTYAANRSRRGVCRR
jgi:hypothetical protein